MKLHLGCGLQYIDGYVNIDYPVSEQSVQRMLKADIYSDLLTLEYENNSIEEIRLHHVFEHFDRTDSLTLLCKWRDWLIPGGLLRIETPDVLSSFKLVASPFRSIEYKHQVMRHIFGSHEASWAIHCDGWYKDKFNFTLGKLGFANMKFVKNKWQALRNIEVFAYKSDDDLAYKEYLKQVRDILSLSTVKIDNSSEPEGTELEMLNVWVNLWSTKYNPCIEENAN